MLYVGLDIHAKQITVCILDQDGKPLERFQVRQLDQLCERLTRLPERSRSASKPAPDMERLSNCFRRWRAASWWRIPDISS